MEIFSFTAPFLEKRTAKPFNELILSWNGFRPKRGIWTFFVSLFQNQWSPFLKYAEWGPSHQMTFQTAPSDSFATAYQDVVTPRSGHCTAFRIEVAGEDLSTLHKLHICCSDTTQFQISPPPSLSSLLLKEVFPQSQQLVPHPRFRDLCSPTSTAAAINFLRKERRIRPVDFVELSRDQGFDIFGNWILNTAAAYETLEGDYQTYVARLPDFAYLHSLLSKGMPVVASVKGPLPGAPLPYAYGHLILVIGYDSAGKKVLCMDPAYESDQKTLVSYPLDDFLRVWGTRRNLAYVFTA